MNVRIRFSKTGPLVYIGHLDVMRYFQKLIRRAQIPVAYSEGFSPHQLLSFTPPLPLGMESLGEYADVRLTGSVSTKEALQRLREQSVDDINIMSFRLLPEKSENAMASVRAARYEVAIPEDLTVAACDAVDSFLKKTEVNIIKKTKKNERTVDIRPLVYELSVDEGSHTINMLISSGSTDNLKPEHILEALFSDGEHVLSGTVPDIKRIDQYTEMNGSLISLDEIGSDIDNIAEGRIE